MSENQILKLIRRVEALEKNGLGKDTKKSILLEFVLEEIDDDIESLYESVRNYFKQSSDPSEKRLKAVQEFIGEVEDDVEKIHQKVGKCHNILNTEDKDL